MLKITKPIVFFTDNDADVEIALAIIDEISERLVKDILKKRPNPFVDEVTEMQNIRSEVLHRLEEEGLCSFHFIDQETGNRVEVAKIVKRISSFSNPC